MNQRKLSHLLMCLGVVAVSAGLAVSLLQGHTYTVKAEEFCDVGEKYFNEENYKEAVDAYTAAINISPRKYEAYAGRAEANYALGNKKEAIDDFVTAVIHDDSLEERIPEEIHDEVITRSEIYLDQEKITENQSKVDEYLKLTEEEYRKQSGSEPEQIENLEGITVGKLSDEDGKIYFENGAAVMAEVPLTSFIPLKGDTDLDQLADALKLFYTDVSFTINEFPLEDQTAVYPGTVYAEYTLGNEGEDPLYMDIGLDRSSTVKEDSTVRIYRNFFTEKTGSKPYKWMTRKAGETRPFPEYIFFMKYVGIFGKINENSEKTDEDSPEYRMKYELTKIALCNCQSVTEDQMIVHDDYIEFTGIKYVKIVWYATKEEAEQKAEENCIKWDLINVNDKWTYIQKDSLIYLGQLPPLEDCFYGSVYLTKDAVIRNDDLDYITGLDNLPVSELFTKGKKLVESYYSSLGSESADSWIWNLCIYEIGDDGYITQIGTMYRG